MSIIAPIAGAYVGTYNSIPLNYTRSGFNLNFTTKAERVEETDIYGLCLIDMVFRGMQATIDTICKVYGAGTIRPLFPWSTVFGRVYSAALPIAQLASQDNNADQLVLTVVANTPAAVAAAPTTLTAGAIISPDNNLAVVFSSMVREVPLRFDLLLQDNTGTGTLFTTT